ncbi:MAG: ABC transporter substrate-binding protein [Burkholderiales bacterium PBB5]|nr:MAG: ABC transporter substrate-binding protein [Burkholderiales bacterium PBB5]
MTFTRRTLVRLALAAPWLPWAAPAQAQTPAWPTKPLRIVVAYPPGGTSDAAARLLAERLAPALGQAVVVENRPGASGTTGMDAVAKSAPDGHTLGFAAISPLTLSPHLGKLPYDALKDLQAVAQVMHSPVYLLATPAFAGRTVADVVARAQAAPGALRVATSGMASVGHVMLAQWQRKAGLQFTHIPYKGGGQVVNDAVGGQFELFTSNPSPAVNAQIAAGKLRVLAVAAPARLALVPEAPTFAELGVAEANLGSVFGLFAPAGVPAAVVKRLNAEVNAVLASKDVQERLARLDNSVSPATPEAFAALLRHEHDATGRVVREAAIRAD